MPAMPLGGMVLLMTRVLASSRSTICHLNARGVRFPSAANTCKTNQEGHCKGVQHSGTAGVQATAAVIPSVSYDMSGPSS